MTFGLEVMGMVVILVVPAAQEEKFDYSLTDLGKSCTRRCWLTRHNVAADDFPTQSGQRFRYNRDDVATGGLDVGGPATGGWYSTNGGANSGSCIGGLGGYIPKYRD